MDHQEPSAGLDRPGSLGLRAAPPTVPRLRSTRGPCPFRGPPGHLCSRSRAAFRATSTRILGVLCVLYSPLCLLHEQRRALCDLVAVGELGLGGDGARRAVSPEGHQDPEHARRFLPANALPSPTSISNSVPGAAGELWP